MLTFITWVAVIGTALCALVFLTLFAVVVTSVINDWKQRQSMRNVYPHPDTSAERMYDVQYFYRANGRTDK